MRCEKEASYFFDLPMASDVRSCAPRDNVSENKTGRARERSSIVEIDHKVWIEELERAQIVIREDSAALNALLAIMGVDLREL